MAKATDVRLMGAALFFLPVHTRLPLKFGPETLTSVTCARVRVVVEGREGRIAVGWGETPLSVQWVWPGSLPYAVRHAALQDFCACLTCAWAEYSEYGHAFEIGHGFTEFLLPEMLQQFNRGRTADEAMPWLAALVCLSACDLALHDAYGNYHDRPVYSTYNDSFLSRDLSAYLTPAEESRVTFEGQYPEAYLVPDPPTSLVAWHLVGGKDAIDRSELVGDEPDDGYPILLRDWIRRDGLRCLKVKLTGTDATWDDARLRTVGQIAIDEGCDWLSADFNCTVVDPAYVTAILDRLLAESPHVYRMLLYVEQPFPYDLERDMLDVRAVSARKPLYLDESAHDWRLVKLGRQLGWSGVALKTCKTQTGALLSLCWAKAHGMPLMVQDLTNPMLAQIPHVLLAAHAGTIMGVETNASQFYPDASHPESTVHTGIYQRHNGMIQIRTLGGAGLGYGDAVSARELPEPAVSAGVY